MKKPDGRPEPCLFTESSAKIQSPRFLGSRFLFWVLAPWLVLGCVAFCLVAKDAFDDSHALRGAFASSFAALCALGLFAMISRKYGLLYGRMIAAIVAIAYLWYFADTYFVEGQSLAPGGRRSDSTPFNAICGFLVIGVPCIIFAVTGRRFWGKRQDEEQPNKLDQAS